MSNKATVEIKAFVPARDFALSKRFYQDLGFTLAWSDDDLACFRHGHSSFLLQNFSQPPDNFMIGRRRRCMVAPRPRTKINRKIRREGRATCGPTMGHAGFRNR
jgi:hypothetical protein